MPLPPALAARLAKRGILRDASVAGYDPHLGKALEPKPQKGRGGSSGGGGGSSGGGGGVPSYGYEGRNLHQPEEEVFAESYDNEGADGGTGPLIFSKPEVDPTKHIGHSGCPNKWNVHHECVLYCRQFWGAGIREPVNMEYIRAHSSMIEKYYPMPDGWREMYDAGVGRHYYWCTKTDQVSWLPPGHPKGTITDPASKVREMLALKEKEKQEETDNADNMDLDSDNESDEEEEDRRLEEQRRREKERRREEERRIVGKDKKGRKGREDESLDPMDPAAYSDVPRGNWSTGLPDQSSAKTGVDGTASGPLFQQRPYPSPGDILRANAAAQQD